MRSDDIFCSRDKLLTLRSVLSCTNQCWRWFFVISSFSFTNYFQWFLTFCYITISQWNRKIGMLTQLYSTDVTSQLAFTWSKLTMHQKKVWNMFERFAYGWRDENIPLLIFFFTYLTKVKLKIYKSRDKALASHSRQYFSCLRSRKLRSFSFAICMVNFIFPTLSMLLRKFRKSSRVLILCVQTEKTPSLKRFQTLGL